MSDKRTRTARGVRYATGPCVRCGADEWRVIRRQLQDRVRFERRCVPCTRRSWHEWKSKRDDAPLWGGKRFGEE